MQRKLISQRLNASVFTLIFLVSLFGVIQAPVAEPQTPPGLNVIVVTDRNYETVLTTISGLGATAYLKVNKTGDSAYRRDFIDLTITNALFASTTAARAVVRSYETDINSNLYLASFRFRPDADPTDPISACSTVAGQVAGYGNILGTCSVRVNNTNPTGNAIMVAGTGLTSATFTWKPSTTAELTTVGNDATPTECDEDTEICPDINGYLDILSVTLDDPELNAVTTAVETYPSGTNPAMVRATSTSDVSGEVIPIVESAVSSGIFTGSLGFEANNFPNNGLLHVRPLDTVRITYTEGANTAGDPEEHVKQYDFQPSSDGAVFLFTEPGGGYFGTGAIGQVFVTDTDRSGNEAANFTDVCIRVGTGACTPSVVSPCTSPEGICVRAREIGGRSGLFVGNFGFKLGAEVSADDDDVGDDVLAGVSHQALITAWYSDEGADNEVRTRTDTARFYTASTVTPGVAGAFRIGTNLARFATDAFPDYRLVGTSASEVIQLTDTDANLDPAGEDQVSVTVKSTTDPVGIPVTLTETAANTGVFTDQGTLAFRTTGTSTQDELRVTSGDFVVAEYNDPHDEFGKPQRVLTRPAVWKPLAAGTVEISAPEYFKVCAAQGTGGKCSAAPMTTKAEMFVTDQDRNHPFVRDSFSVKVVSTAHPTGIDVTMQETGVDTGVFRAGLSFRDDASNEDQDAILVENDGDTITVQYADPFRPGGQEPSASATWRRGPLDATPGEIAANNPLVLRLENLTAGKYVGRQNVAYISPFVNADTAVLEAVTLVFYGAFPAGTEAKFIVSSPTCPNGADGEPVKIGPVVQGGAAGALVDNAKGRWIKAFSLRTVAPVGTAPICPNSASQTVGVRVGDTVTLSHETLTVTAADTISIRAEPTQRSRWVDRDYSTTVVRTIGTESPGRFLITDMSRNNNTQARDVIFTKVASGAGSFPGSDSLPAVETGPDSGIFLSSVGFCQTAACSSSTNALLQVSNTEIDGVGGVKDSAKVQYGGPLVVGATSTLDWYEGNEPALTVAPSAGGGTEAFGTGHAQLVTLGGLGALEDGAGTGSRVFNETHATSGSKKNDFVVGSGTFVRGSELVIASTIQENPGTSQDPAVAPHLAKLDSPITLVAKIKAAEAITDRNFDGRVSCEDVTIKVFNANGAEATAVCKSVTDATGTGVVDFTNTCSGSTPTVQVACSKVRISHEYRAKFDAAQSDVYAYKNEPPATTNPIPTTIKFGASLPIDRLVRLEYAKTTRTVKLTSTGATETETLTLTYQSGTKTFTGTFLAETTQASGNGKIKVTAPNSVISVTYLDPSKPWGEAAGTNVRDYRAKSTPIVWRNTTDAAITFHDPEFTRELPSTVAGPFVAVEILNPDADLSDRRDAITATALAAGTADAAIGITLRETEANSGRFRGVIPANNVAGPDPDGLDFPTIGGTLQVIYTDPHQASNGLTKSVSLSRPWVPAINADILLCLSPFTTSDLCGTTAGTSSSPDNRIKGSAGALYVQVSDADSNTRSDARDSIDIRVYSNRTGSQNPKVFSLQESGEATGVFRSSPIRFEPFATQGVRVLAADLDWISVRYDDPSGAEGFPLTRCRPDPDPEVFDCFEAQWDQTFDGAIRFASEQYLGATSDTQTGLLNRGIIIFPDGDLNTNATLVECYEIALTATAACNADPRITLDTTASSPGAEPKLKLYETGANSGVFVGNLSFNATAINADESGSINARIKVVSEGLVKLEYTDDVGVTGTAPTLPFKHEAKWFNKGRGVPVFNKETYTRDGEVAGITLFDFSNATATTPPPSSYTVNVQSQTQSTPVAVTLTSASTTPGIYAGTLVITTATSGGIRVRGLGQEDLLSLTYADAEPVGTRSTTAKVRVGDFIPPVTTLTISPTAPNGENGFYVTEPRITLTVNEDVVPVTGTKYRIDNAPLNNYLEAFNVEEGTHNITYFSTDLSENVEANKVFPVKVDPTAPTQVAGNLQATAIAGGKVRLNWTLANPPTDFQRYNVYREGQTLRLGNATTGNFTDQTPEDKAWRYHVEVVDLAGNKGLPSPLSNAVTTDRKVPVVSSALAEPASFDIRDGITSVALSATVTDPSNNLERVVADVGLPGTNFTQNITLSGNITSGGRFTGTFANFTLPGIYQAAFKGIDRVGNEGRQLVNISIFGPDSIDPQITVSPPSGSSIPQGVPITITASDNFGISSLRYQVDGGAFFNVAVPAGYPSSLPVNVPTAALALGAHSMTIETVDKPDLGVTRTTTLTITFTIVPGGDLPTTLFLSNVKVSSKRDGSIEVSWAAPGSTGNKLLAGYIVWRSASPFQPVAYLDADDTKYVDTNTTKGATYKYAVSWFATDGFGNVSAIEQVTGYPGSDDALGGTTGKSRTGLSALQWFLLVGIPLIAVALAIALAMVVRTQRRRPPGQQVVGSRRKPGAAEVEDEDASARPKPAEQRHVLKCPQCQHRFEVYGTKPIVTNCPNCGRKGILR